MVRVADRDGERVGSIVRLRGGLRQENTEHDADLVLVGVARADDGLLHEVRRVFGDRNPGARRNEHCDAARLTELLKSHGIEKVSAVVSSLPLLSLPAEVVNGIVHGVFASLPAGAPLIQFTYGPSPPVPKALRERLGLQGVGGKRIWRNVPPAVVWIFTRPAGR